MIWLMVILLAVLQGVTEFLPVSSSGHLAVLSDWFGLESDQGAAFGIILHAGSLAAIVVFYWQTLLDLLRKAQWKLIWLIILGTIPAGIAGVIIKKCGLLDRFFGDPIAIAFAFLVTGAVLRLTGKKSLLPPVQRPLEELTPRRALCIGLSQMVAILPGISRSGSTIAAGIFCGLPAEDAAKFSFLLALPAIGGAALLEVLDLRQAGWALGSFTAWHLLTGLAVSFAVSFLALKLLIKLLGKGKFHYFSIYLFILGAALLLQQLLQACR